MKPHNITYNGKTQSIRAWAREVGMSQGALLYRLNMGWAAERALTEPVSASQRKGHPWKRHNPSYMRGMRT